MFRFRLGPFPVVVSPSFLVAAVLLGGLGGEVWQTVAWVLIVFVAVLLHELGHALVGRRLGGQPEIHLVGFGGETHPRLRRRIGAAAEILLSVAGPVAGLATGLLGGALLRLLPPDPGSPAFWVIITFVRTSVLWAGFNLLPVLPLDGGHILLSGLEKLRGKPSLQLASWLSAAAAVLLGLAALLSDRGAFDPLFVALWFGLFAVQNVLRARQLGRAAVPASAPAPATNATERADVESATGRARAALLAQDVPAALAAAESLELGAGAFRQAAGLRLRAGIELARGDNRAAALYAGQSFSLFQNPDAAVVAARANLRAGQAERARNWLQRAVESGAEAQAVRGDPELGALS